MIERFKSPMSQTLLTACCILILAHSYFAIIGYSEAHAAYKIILKNGSSLLVEGYKELDGRIQFFRSGGFIEIDKSDISEIKEVSTEIPEIRETGENKSQEVLPQPSSPEVNTQDLRMRLEEIQKEKEILKEEIEQIQKEADKLSQEIRKEGRVLAIRKKRELEKKKGELENRVTEINKKIEELQKEEENILNQLRGY